MSSIKVWEGTHTKVQSSNFRSMSYSNILTLDLASIYKKNSRLECRRLYVCEYFNLSPQIWQFCDLIQKAAVFEMVSTSSEHVLAMSQPASMLFPFDNLLFQLQATITPQL